MLVEFPTESPPESGTQRQGAPRRSGPRWPQRPSAGCSPETKRANALRLTLGPPDAADIGDMSRPAAIRRRRDLGQLDSRKRSATPPVARSGVMGRSNSHTMAAECPVKTGTLVRASSSPRARAARGSCGLRCRTSAPRRSRGAVVDDLELERYDVVGDRDRVRGARRVVHGRAVEGQVLRPVDDVFENCSASSRTASTPPPDTAWYVALTATSRRRPASSSRGL